MESVVKCQPSGKEWNGKPIYSIGLSDGRGGESFSQIAVGTSVNDLQIDQSPYGLKIKKKSSQQFGGGGKFQTRNESFALAYAKDLVVGGKVDIKNILSTADKLYAWLEGKKGQAPTQTAATVQQPEKVHASPINASQDDLPF